jgi:hypothetical protein
MTDREALDEVIRRDSLYYLITYLESGKKLSAYNGDCSNFMMRLGGINGDPDLDSPSVVTRFILEHLTEIDTGLFDTFKVRCATSNAFRFLLFISTSTLAERICNMYPDLVKADIDNHIDTYLRELTNIFIALNSREALKRRDLFFKLAGEKRVKDLMNTDMWKDYYNAKLTSSGYRILYKE